MARRSSGEPEGGGLSYITPEGEARLRAEIERLWNEERPRVTREVKAAAALGDRSENAEYIYGKKRLREIDARLRFLSKRATLRLLCQPKARLVLGFPFGRGFPRPTSGI